MARAGQNPLANFLISDSGCLVALTLDSFKATIYKLLDRPNFNLRKMENSRDFLLTLHSQFIPKVNFAKKLMEHLEMNGYLVTVIQVEFESMLAAKVEYKKDIDELIVELQIKDIFKDSAGNAKDVKSFVMNKKLLMVLVIFQSPIGDDILCSDFYLIESLVNVYRITSLEFMEIYFGEYGLLENHMKEIWNCNDSDNCDVVTFNQPKISDRKMPSGKKGGWAFKRTVSRHKKQITNSDNSNGKICTGEASKDLGSDVVIFNQTMRSNHKKPLGKKHRWVSKRDIGDQKEEITNSDGSNGKIHAGEASNDPSSDVFTFNQPGRSDHKNLMGKTHRRVSKRAVGNQKEDMFDSNNSNDKICTGETSKNLGSHHKSRHYQHLKPSKPEANMKSFNETKAVNRIKEECKTIAVTGDHVLEKCQLIKKLSKKLVNKECKFFVNFDSKELLISGNDGKILQKFHDMFLQHIKMFHCETLINLNKRLFHLLTQNKNMNKHSSVILAENELDSVVLFEDNLNGPAVLGLNRIKTRNFIEWFGKFFIKKSIQIQVQPNGSIDFEELRRTLPPLELNRLVTIEVTDGEVSVHGLATDVFAVTAQIKTFVDRMAKHLMENIQDPINFHSSIKPLTSILSSTMSSVSKFPERRTPMQINQETIPSPSSTKPLTSILSSTMSSVSKFPERRTPMQINQETIPSPSSTKPLTPVHHIKMSTVSKSPERRTPMQINQETIPSPSSTKPLTPVHHIKMSSVSKSPETRTPMQINQETIPSPSSTKPLTPVHHIKMSTVSKFPETKHSIPTFQDRIPFPSSTKPLTPIHFGTTLPLSKLHETKHFTQIIQEPFASHSLIKSRMIAGSVPMLSADKLSAPSLNKPCIKSASYYCYNITPKGYNESLHEQIGQPPSPAPKLSDQYPSDETPNDQYNCRSSSFRSSGLDGEDDDNYHHPINSLIFPQGVQFQHSTMASKSSDQYPPVETETDQYNWRSFSFKSPALCEDDDDDDYDDDDDDDDDAYDDDDDDDYNNSNNNNDGGVHDDGDPMSSPTLPKDVQFQHSIVAPELLDPSIKTETGRYSWRSFSFRSSGPHGDDDCDNDDRRGTGDDSKCSPILPKVVQCLHSNSEHTSLQVPDTATSATSQQMRTLSAYARYIRNTISKFRQKWT